MSKDKGTTDNNTDNKGFRTAIEVNWTNLDSDDDTEFWDSILCITNLLQTDGQITLKIFFGIQS